MRWQRGPPVNPNLTWASSGGANLHRCYIGYHLTIRQNNCFRPYSAFCSSVERTSERARHESSKLLHEYSNLPYARSDG